MRAIRSCEVVKNDAGRPELVVMADHVDTFDDIYREMVEDRMEDILSFLRNWEETHTPPGTTDWDTYEGGIADWWGPGSVGLYELGLTFQLTLTDEGIKLVVS